MQTYLQFLYPSSVLLHHPYIHFLVVNDKLQRENVLFPHWTQRDLAFLKSKI